MTTTSAPDPPRTEELYAEHHRVVLVLCRALLRDRAEAEDATQQTFLSAHRALANGSAPREPAAWLATIARNECWGRIRSRMREPLASADLDLEASLSDPVDEAIRRADLAALWQAIRGLPPQQRDALLLREFGGLTYEELAAALAVSTPAVESLLFRARSGLRARLRTAYAALSGASWIEWLGRLVAGGSAPAAAKVAAVGMSAAVVTGGAVVTPQLLEHHVHRRPPRAETATTTKGSAVPVLVVEHARAKVVRPRAERRREAEPADTETEHQQASAGSEDQGGGSGEHGGSGDDAPELDSGEGH